MDYKLLTWATSKQNPAELNSFDVANNPLAYDSDVKKKSKSVVKSLNRHVNTKTPNGRSRVLTQPHTKMTITDRRELAVTYR